MFEKQPFNIWRAVHTRAALKTGHPLETEQHGARKKERILRHEGLQTAREKPLSERASETAAANGDHCDNKPICVAIEISQSKGKYRIPWEKMRS